jgi:hypothetical protein
MMKTKEFRCKHIWCLWVGKGQGDGKVRCIYCDIQKDAVVGRQERRKCKKQK